MLIEKNFNNCLYCNDKDIKSRVIFEDNLVMVFPTNIPITPGHLLICPKRHISKIDALSDEELKAIKDLIVRLKNTLAKTFGAEGFNVALNEGQSAGQSIDHLHIHIVPRKAGDAGIYEYEPRKFLYRPGSRNTSPENELREITELIKKNI
ncbi:MAG: HIT family protein [Patescibacteria group bacterium]|jgi:diadenosine tetraphosphate (Ap4A) HIT family hydrolase